MKSLTCLCKTTPSKPVDEYNKLKRKLKTSTILFCDTGCRCGCISSSWFHNVVRIYHITRRSR